MEKETLHKALAVYDEIRACEIALQIANLAGTFDSLGQATERAHIEITELDFDKFKKIAIDLINEKLKIANEKLSKI